MTTTATTGAPTTSTRVFPHHPEYDARLPDWQQMVDTYAGERQVKDRGTTYLPPTESMRLQGLGTVTLAENHPVRLEYEDYKLRAKYPEYVADAVGARLGVLHRKAPKVELPPKFEHLARVATIQGESAEALLRRMNEQQLVPGRIGLLVDPPDGAAVNKAPLIATYVATSILNWSSKVNPKDGTEVLVFLALDESTYEMDARYTWQWVAKTRLLRLNEKSGRYETATIVGGQQPANADWVEPKIGNTALDYIPFVIVNVTDVQVTCPAKPPLLGLSNQALAIYRGEADHRQHLHRSGQDTLLVKGRPDPDEPLKVGAGSIIDVPKDGDAKYIGITGLGLPEQRTSLENDHKQAASAAATMDTKRSAEAAEALRQRIAQGNASLMTMASAAGEGLTMALRIVVGWAGGDADKVVVAPNFEFVEDEFSSADLEALVRAKLAGAPITDEDLFRFVQKHEIVPPEVTYKEQRDKLDAEEMERASRAAQGDLDPLGGGDPDDEGEDEQDPPAPDGDE